MKVSRLKQISSIILIICVILATLFWCVEKAQIYAQLTDLYSPELAYNYAYKYWNRVCSDGYFFKKSYPPSYLGSGVFLSQDLLTGGVDCAHFVSCCIGDEPNERGGGLDVPSRTEAYGEPGAERLGNWLLDPNNGIAQQVSSIDELKKGDVINYDWNGDGHWDHTAFYLGDYKVAAHSVSVWNESWQLGGARNYRFIHIIAPFVDVVLTIDRSGSMDDYWYGYYDPEITAAKSSAKWRWL